MRASGVGVAEAAGVAADLCGRLCSGRADWPPMNSAATAQRIIRNAKDGVTASIPMSGIQFLDQSSLPGRLRVRTGSGSDLATSAAIPYKVFEQILNRLAVESPRRYRSRF